MCCANVVLISVDYNGHIAYMLGLCQTANVNVTFDYFDELPSYRNPCNLSQAYCKCHRYAMQNMPVVYLEIKQEIFYVLGASFKD